MAQEMDVHSSGEYLALWTVIVRFVSLLYLQYVQTQFVDKFFRLNIGMFCVVNFQ